MMIQEAMVKGDPEHGILPSGQVARLIDYLPSVQRLIIDIMREADETSSRLAGTLQLGEKQE